MRVNTALCLTCQVPTKLPAAVNGILDCGKHRWSGVYVCKDCGTAHTKLTILAGHVFCHECVRRAIPAMPVPFPLPSR